MLVDQICIIVYPFNSLNFIFSYQRFKCAFKLPHNIFTKAWLKLLKGLLLLAKQKHLALKHLSFPHTHKKMSIQWIYSKVNIFDNPNNTH